MQPQNIHFGGGPAQSVFNPIVLFLAILAGILILFLPRNKVIIPLFALAILVPADQILVLGSLHFPMVRILVFFGMLRILWSKITGKEELFSGGINGIDKSIFLLTAFTAIDSILLWQAWGEVVFQLGLIYSTLGTYALLRFVIRDQDDVKRTLRVWACVVSVVAAVMICEQMTGHNPIFEALGGARASDLATVTVRGDALRATGTFQHPILAGTFGGISFPLFIGLWWLGEKKDRKYAVIGAVASALIPFLTSSSTTVLGFAAGVFALFCWVVRRYMRPIRWGIVLTLIGLHLVMNGPVWALINRINLTGNSSSDHRYMLVNECIVHFWDWALIGVKNTGVWGWDMWDLSNQYVATADMNGLIPLISFLAIIVFGFKYLGRARRTADQGQNRKQELFIWALSGSLFANVVAFFGVSYWDQIIVAWYALLVIICAATLSARSAPLERNSVPLARPASVLAPSLAAGPARYAQTKVRQTAGSSSKS